MARGWLIRLGVAAASFGIGIVADNVGLMLLGLFIFGGWPFITWFFRQIFS